MNQNDLEYLFQNLDTQELYGSDSCIANLFLLQEKYSIELTIHNDILFRYYHGNENRNGYGFPIPLKTKSEDKNNFLKNALEYIIKDARTQNRAVSFCLITQEQKNKIDECLSENFSGLKILWNTNRDDSDYLYLCENLASLPGSNYQKKRNHISRFNRTYGEHWQFKLFPENDIAQDILAVSEIWYHEKNGDEDYALQLEHQSIQKAVENAELLRVRGGVLYIDNKPCAMTLASPISDTVLDVIYEKAVADHEKNGIYAAINHQFAKSCGTFLYSNREEDMGVEGLRKAKLSYKPSIILDKFYGTLS